MYFQTNLREKKLHWRNSQIGQRYSISTKLWRILSGEFFSSKFSFTSPLCYRMRFDFEVRSYLGLSYNDEIQVPVFVCLVQLLFSGPWTQSLAVKDWLFDRKYQVCYCCKANPDSRVPVLAFAVKRWLFDRYQVSSIKCVVVPRLGGIKQYKSHWDWEINN